jgi:hypothetical protein
MYEKCITIYSFKLLPPFVTRFITSVRPSHIITYHQIASQSVTRGVGVPSVVHSRSEHVLNVDLLRQTRTYVLMKGW